MIRFVNKLDPNGGGLFDFDWPKYTTDNPKQLIFLDGLIPQVIGEDTYRQEQMDFLTDEKGVQEVGCMKLFSM